MDMKGGAADLWSGRASFFRLFFVVIYHLQRLSGEFLGFIS